MAHRSKKKHLKHLHAHEPATPPAKSPIAKAEAAAAGIAKQRSRRPRAAEPRQKQRGRRPRAAEPTPKQRPGLVRRVASKASEAIAEAGKLPSKLAGKLPGARRLAEKLPRARGLTAKPAKVLKRVKARVMRSKQTAARAH